ncbi:molecular chaperone TorD [Desulfovibrio sp. JC022]|uniref:molecular chaperone TorD n=1 Tax=Desulfovibrio sp. JC022 TaxID=2593642 RepID=UPI0013D1CEF9|nr:molecular chaperone TorD [Desulfovibrio sp. JC022]NDV23323.1 molecular chaperone TorD [Desulfovibrio sp. JC022]
MNVTTELNFEEQRTVAYRWLSSLFMRELNREQLDSYRAGENSRFPETVSAFTGKNEALERVTSELGKTHTDDSILDLASEYGRLFLGAGGPLAVPPYESFFTSESNTTHQQAETEVSKLMAEYGIGVNGSFTEPADHVAVLLEFMAFLSTEQEETEDTTVAFARSKSFLETHLLNWIPDFANTCKEVEPEGFYTSAAELTADFLQADQNWLESKLNSTQPQ